MEKEIFDELNRIADDFWNERKTLNHNKIENLRYISGFAFTTDFNKALKEFLIVRRWNLEDHDSGLDKIMEVNPIKDYTDACDNFFKVVTIAKSNYLFIDIEMRKELDEYKEKYSDLEIENEKNKSIIKKQQIIIDSYVTKIKNAIQTHPKLSHFFGAQESGVEEID